MVIASNILFLVPVLSLMISWGCQPAVAAVVVKGVVVVDVEDVVEVVVVDVVEVVVVDVVEVVVVVRLVVVVGINDVCRGSSC